MIKETRDLINLTVQLDERRNITFMSDDKEEITYLRLLKSQLDEDWKMACKVACIEAESPAYFFIEEIWDTIVPVGVVEVQRKVRNADRKALIFRFIRVAEMFKAEGAKCLDKREIVTQNTTWDKGNHPITKPLVNRFELWTIAAEKIYPNMEGQIFSVRCWCPSTDREFFIVVDSSLDFCKRGKYNALEAIASTALCPISNPAAIYRQGDVLFFVHGDNSQILAEPVRLDAKTYFSLLVSQT